MAERGDVPLRVIRQSPQPSLVGSPICSSGSISLAFPCRRLHEPQTFNKKRGGGAKELKGKGYDKGISKARALQICHAHAHNLDAWQTTGVMCSQAKGGKRYNWKAGGCNATFALHKTGIDPEAELTRVTWQLVPGMHKH